MGDGTLPASVVHDAVQSTQQDINEGGALLVGWVLVSEWQDADGDRRLARLTPEGTPCWQANGYLHEALYGEWPDDDADVD